MIQNQSDNFLSDPAIERNLLLTAASNTEAAEDFDEIAAATQAIASGLNGKSAAKLLAANVRTKSFGGLTITVERHGEDAELTIDLEALRPPGAVCEPFLLAMRFTPEKFDDPEAAAYEYGVCFIEMLAEHEEFIRDAAKHFRKRFPMARGGEEQAD